MKILEELWYGNINPNERDVEPSSKLHKLGALIVRHEENLLPLLSEQAKETTRSCGTVNRSCTGSTNVRLFASVFGSAPESHMRQWRGTISPPLIIKGVFP